MGTSDVLILSINEKNIIMKTIICIALTLLMITPMANAQTKIKQTAGREQLGEKRAVGRFRP